MNLTGRLGRLERQALPYDAHEGELSAGRERLLVELEGYRDRLLTWPSPPDPAHESPVICWTWESILAADDRAPRDTADWEAAFWMALVPRLQELAAALRNRA